MQDRVEVVGSTQVVSLHLLKVCFHSCTETAEEITKRQILISLSLSFHPMITEIVITQFYMTVESHLHSEFRSHNHKNMLPYAKRAVYLKQAADFNTCEQCGFRQCQFVHK